MRSYYCCRGHEKLLLQGVLVDDAVGLLQGFLVDGAGVMRNRANGFLEDATPGDMRSCCRGFERLLLHGL